MKAWPILGVLIVQSLLFLIHWFLYCTWIDFGWPITPAASSILRVALFALSLLFVVAALISFRFSNWLVALLYQLAGLWMGLLNFLFVGACLAWLIDLVLRFTMPNAVRLQTRPYLTAWLLALAIAVSLYGMANARILRLRRMTVKLDRLPESWRGRTALVFSDVHLGHINHVPFAQRIAGLANRLNPDVIFLPGDLFDGVKVDPAVIAAPLFELAPPLGKFFVCGNHEEFGDAAYYCDGLRDGGFRVLDNERVEVDGLAIVGVNYSTSTHPMALRHFLQGLHLAEGPATVLLQHVPNRLPIVEQAGVGLMLSGHTHGGQVFPFSWITRRAFGKFTHGLHRFGALQVLTSSGIGTWGPPMRVGTAPEAVLLTFE